MCQKDHCVFQNVLDFVNWYVILTQLLEFARQIYQTEAALKKTLFSITNLTPPIMYSLSIWGVPEHTQFFKLVSDPLEPVALCSIIELTPPKV